MANRVLQQKRFKMQRMRRAWAKPYSMKKNGPDPNSMQLLAQRTKAAQTIIDPWLEKLFPDRNPLNKPDLIYSKHASVTQLELRQIPRAVVLAKLRQSVDNAGSLQKEQKFIYQKIEEGPKHFLRLYMCGDDNFYVRMSVGKKSICYVTSIHYSSSSRAEEARKNGMIVWEWKNAKYESLDPVN